MLQREIVRFRASDTQPNPLEVDYWIDVTSNYYGGCIRYYRNDTNTWEMLDLNDKQVDAIIDYINKAFDQIEQFINDSITEIRNELAEFKDELKEEVNRLDTKIDDVNEDLQDFKALKGQPNGLAELDSNGKVPASQLPSVVNSMPDNLLSTFQLDQTDVNNITISLTGVEKSGGKYVQSTLADITITPATNTVAGLMTGAEKLAINETLPDAINDEKTAREAAVNELKAKDTELQGNIDSLEDVLNEDITELRTTLLKVNDKVGLTEANEMPDLSSTNYLANSPSAISAAVTLDEEIGKLSRNENELWYGVKFDLANSSSPDGVRTGNMEMHRTLPIQSKMRGCTISNTDNVKKYLKANDWTKWEDGTTSSQDSSGVGVEAFVEIPEHYRLLIATPDNTVEIRMSEYNLPGYTKVEKKYIGAYEGSVNLDSSSHNNLLRTQVCNTAPIISKTRTEFQTMARNNNRTNNWNIYTYDAHRDLTWLFVVEYATLNSQKAFNANLTAEGYHQGGLGDGVTSGTVTVNGATTYSFVPCGTTNSLGNGTGIIKYTHTNTNAEGTSTGTKVVNVPRYRGIENPFGHVWKNVIDVVVAGTDNSVYICKDYTKFGTFEGGTNPTAEQLIAAGYELQDFKESTITDQYVKKLVNNNQADLFPTVVGNGVSATTYYCDYHWTSATATPRTLLIGGRLGIGSGAGLFGLRSSDGLDNSGATVGTRITFYGEPALPAAPATLELNDEDYEQLDSIESEENWF